MDLSLGHFANVVGGRVRRLREVRGSGQIKKQSTPRFSRLTVLSSAALFKEMEEGSERPTRELDQVQ